VILIARGAWPLVAHRGAAKTARLFAARQPWLGDDVISAVELSDAASDPRRDSPVFRAMAQSRVGDKLAHVRVAALLPWNLAARLLAAAAILTAIAAGLCLIPGLSLGTSLARAFLPLSGIERVTRNTITLLSPARPGDPVPRGDPVDVVVRVGGPGVDRVDLSISAGGGSASLAAMQPGPEPGQYHATVPVGNEPVAFRVRAGDAVSPRYVLDSRARPAVVRFEKIYDFPPYTRMDRRITTEDQGDLDAIEGTRVALTLVTDQPTKAAVLRITRGDAAEDLALIADAKDPLRLRATVPVTASGSYEVRLVARETGFANTFRPQYQVTAQPDLRPTIQLDEPGRTLRVAPDTVVEVRGIARDDVGLARVSQVVAVNQSEAATTAWWKDDGKAVVKEWAIARRWSIADLHLKPGDEATMRLTAVDLKGNAAESEPVFVKIVTPDAALAENSDGASPLDESLAALAAAAEAQRGEIQSLAAVAGRDEVFSAKAKAVGEAQAELDREVGAAMEQLRSEADGRDLLTAEGREAARDADDARAMIGKPAQQAREDLAAGAAALTAAEREKKLADAAEQQGRLAAALHQRADHYQKAGEGDPQATRAALRQAEEPLGIRAPFDAQYGQVAKLAAMTRMAPDDLAAALGKELARNAAMRDELANLGRDAAAEAKAKLDRAAAAEKQLANDLASQTPPAPRAAGVVQQAVGDKARGAAEDLARAAADARKLAAHDPAQAKNAAAMQDAANQLDGVNKNELAAAEQAVKTQSPSNAQPRVQHAAEALAAKADAIAKALASATPAAPAEAQAMPGAPAETSTAAQPAAEASRWMAAALHQSASKPGAAPSPSAAEASPSPTPGSDTGATAKAAASPENGDDSKTEPSATPLAAADTRAGAANSTSAAPTDPPDAMSGAGAAAGQGGEPSAMQAAFEAQARALREARQASDNSPARPSQGGVAGKGNTTSAGGSGSASVGHGGDAPATFTPAAGGAWGSLTPQQARDLAAAHHDRVSPEYRADVDAYFRAIAERANVGSPR
jgi:hypothetical protein